MRLIEMMLGEEALLDMDVIDGELEIAGLTCDSRAVRPGFLFAALPGAKVDGRDYIQNAQASGAICVLAPVGTRADLPVIEDANVRQRFARMAANFYARQPEPSAAVTGTNGKTSVASFTRQIWQALGHDAASLGTLGLQPPRADAPASLTTPDSVELHSSSEQSTRYSSASSTPGLSGVDSSTSSAVSARNGPRNAVS